MKNARIKDKAASGKTNSWVDPSFTDLTEDRRGGVLRSAVRSRKRRGDARSSSPPTSRLLSVPRDQDESWVDRYAPRSKAELAVHKKKTEEVENWIRVHARTSEGHVLLLTGPSGSGKTATVRVLCQELGLQVQEWTSPPGGSEPYISQHDWTRGVSFVSSQLSHFKEFVLRSSRYMCLRMDGDTPTAHCKVLLVEEFPNQFYKQPESLHTILRTFVRTSRCPLVLVLSDSLSGDTGSRLLFPRQLLDELDISSISFNPVAPTAMMKVLSYIAAQEAGKGRDRKRPPDHGVLERLCSGSSGDIRSAINSLQFSSVPDSSEGPGPWRRGHPLSSLSKAASRPQLKKEKTRPRSMEMEEEEEMMMAIGGKDASLFLFRALGKILHCKREDPDSGVSPDLPSHLSQHHRHKLLIDPELVVERCHMSGQFFSLYLHQNYLDFFSEVEDVEQASAYLSDADLLTSDWTSRSSMCVYGSSVATRGLLHANSQNAAVGFKPLHKPAWLLVDTKHRENCQAAQNLFRSFCLTPVSLQTELLPYLNHLSNPLRNHAQITFIQDVGHMSLRRFSARFDLEALTDKDPGQLKSEEEEGGGVSVVGGGDEGLPSSQTHPVTHQSLEEDELIEEFDSD